MHLNTTRENLVKNLSRVMGVVGRGADLFDKPILANVALRLTEAGELCVTASDMQVEMTATMPVEKGFTPGQGTLPARKLFDILRGLPAGCEVALTIGDQRQGGPLAPPVERAVLAADNGRYTLATLPAADFPSISVHSGAKRLDIDIDARKLAGMMTQCEHAMADNDVRIYLNAMLLHVRPGQVACVASDGHRLTCATLKENTAIAPTLILVARKAAQELRAILQDAEGTVRLEVGEKLLTVRTGAMTFTTLLVDQKFPDYERMLPVGDRSQIRVERKSLLDAVERADILCENTHHAVTINVVPNQVRVHGSNASNEDAQEVVDADTRIAQLRIGVNANYLIDALRSTATQDVCLHVRDAETSVLVTEWPDAQNLTHVIMPVRL
jgi:DNA polymerase-3 subunit beta